MIDTDLRFPSGERLKSRSAIDALFKEASHFFAYPFRFQYRLLADTGAPVQVAFVVSKRKFRKAVQRNPVRRRMREAWRLQRHTLLAAETFPKKGIQLMIIYSGKPEDTAYPTIERGIRKGIQRLRDQLHAAPGAS